MAHKPASSARRHAARLPSQKLMAASREPFQRIAGIGLRMHGLRSTDELHQFVIDAAAELSGAGRVLLVLETASGLQIAAARLPEGEAAPVLLQAISPWITLARDTRTACLRHGPDGARAPDQRSCLIAPLIAREQVFGFLYADIDGASGRFTETDRDLLTMLAAQAAVAQGNAQWAQGLEAKVEERTRELSVALERQTATAEVLRVLGSSMTEIQPVFDAIVKNCGNLMHGSRVVFWLVEADKLRARASNGGLPSLLVPIDHTSPIGACVSDVRVIDLPDLVAAVEQYPLLLQLGVGSGFGSAMYAPLVHQDRAIGGLAVLQRAAGAFDRNDIGLLETFAGQAVIAIENVRLFNETKEALEQQTASAEVLQVISSSVADAAPVFEKILDSCQHLFATEQLGIFLARDDGQVHVVAFRGSALAAVVSTFPKPLDQTATGVAFRERRTVHIPDAAGMPDIPPIVRDVVKQIGNHSSACVPMLWKERGVGSIVALRHPPRPFTDKELALLKTFADQAVIAIQNARLFNETKEALERQTATAEILKVIASSPDNVQPVFDAIAASSNRLIGAFSTAVFRILDDMVHLVAFTSTNPAGDEALKSSFPLALSAFPLAALIRDGATGQFADTEAPSGVPPLSRDLARARGYRGMLFCPLLRDKTAVGMISVTRREPGAFPEHQVQLLQTFADQAVIAIENVRLFNETKEALEQQTATAEVLEVISNSVSDTAPVFEKILDSCRHLFGTEQLGIFLVGDDKIVRMGAWQGSALDAIASSFPRPLDQTITGRVIRDRRVMHIADVAAMPDRPASLQLTLDKIGNYSAVFAPLLWEDRGIGSIMLMRQPPGLFKDKEIALLETFADQAVIAIENARLFNETKEALEHQKASAEVLSVIGSSVSDTKPVFERILLSCSELFGADQYAVMLVDDHGQLDIAEYHGAAREVVAATLPSPVERTPAGWAIRERRVLHYADPLGDDTTPRVLRRIAEQVGNFAIAMAPMLWEERGVGTIQVIRTTPPRPFTTKELALLKTFADQAVIAIQNARLFNETREALERQTATAEILKVIAASPDNVQPVFDAIANSSNRLIGAFSTAVFRILDDRVHLVAFTSTNAADDAALKSSFPVALAAFPLAPLIRDGATGQFADTEASSVPPLSRDLARVRGYRSMLFCPLVRDQTTIGLISVTRREPGAFAQHQVQLLQTFADQAVIAIENVRLFNETKEALEQQKASAEILSVISSSVADTQPVFEKILQSCKHLFGGDELDVLLVDEQGS